MLRPRDPERGEGRSGLKSSIDLCHTDRVCITISQLRYPTKETFETYSKMTGHGTEQKALAAHDKFGLNKFDVPLPPFGDLLKDQLMAPFFVFQVFCVLLWMLDQYWWAEMIDLPNRITGN